MPLVSCLKQMLLSFLIRSMVILLCFIVLSFVFATFKGFIKDYGLSFFRYTC